MRRWWRTDRRRDTDHDWALIGASEPYFGVLSHEKFKRAALDDVARAEFFISGEHDTAAALERMRELAGRFEPRSALDFGCGVGRLTRPLARLTGDAVGVDSSPGMLSEARLNAVPQATFCEAIPDRSFDWVVSIIVLQHIPPARGYALIEQLLGAVTPGGGVTLQLTYARSAMHERAGGARLVIDGSEVRPTRSSDPNRSPPPGTMVMHDYDLSRVIALLHAGGFGAIRLDPSDHGGHIGVTIYALRAA